LDGGADGRGVGSATGDARPDASFATRHWVNRNDGTPGKLVGPKLVYDDARGTVLLYGGDTATTPNAGLFELTSSGWVTICNPCAPGPGYAHAMTYDRARDRVVLYGSSMPNGLWEWDGTVWMQIMQTGAAPAPREFAQLVYDTQRARAVLIGGRVSTTADDQVY